MAVETVTVLVDADLLNEAIARKIDIRAVFEAQLRRELRSRGIFPQDELPQPETPKGEA